MDFECRTGLVRINKHAPITSTDSGRRTSLDRRIFPPALREYSTKKRSPVHHTPTNHNWPRHHLAFRLRHVSKPRPAKISSWTLYSFTIKMDLAASPPLLFPLVASVVYSLLRAPHDRIP